MTVKPPPPPADVMAEASRTARVRAIASRLGISVTDLNRAIKAGDPEAMRAAVDAIPLDEPVLPRVGAENVRETNRLMFPEREGPLAGVDMLEDTLFPGSDPMQAAQARHNASRGAEIVESGTTMARAERVRNAMRALGIDDPEIEGALLDRIVTNARAADEEIGAAVQRYGQVTPRAVLEEAGAYTPRETEMLAPQFPDLQTEMVPPPARTPFPDFPPQIVLGEHATPGGRVPAYRDDVIAAMKTQPGARLIEGPPPRERVAAGPPPRWNPATDPRVIAPSTVLAGAGIAGLASLAARDNPEVESAPPADIPMGAIDVEVVPPPETEPPPDMAALDRSGMAQLPPGPDGPPPGFMTPVSPREDIFQTIELDPNNPGNIKALQRLLADKGFDPGAIDGVVGDDTNAALDAIGAAYQMSRRPTLEEAWAMAESFPDRHATLADLQALLVQRATRDGGPNPLAWSRYPSGIDNQYGTRTRDELIDAGVPEGILPPAGAGFPPELADQILWEMFYRNPRYREQINASPR
jgi:hypothetical protein